MKGPLRQKVAAYLGEGEFDSQGRFTLDAERARVTLARWQMANPWDWMLKGIQAAVAAGVQLVVMRQNRLGTQMEWEHFEAPPEWMEQLPDLLTRPLTSEHPLVHLGLAFRGAPGQVRLHMAGQQLQCLDGLLSQQPVAHGKFCLESLQTDPPGWAAWMWQSLTGNCPEFAAVRQRAQYCPIRLALDGRLVRPGAVKRSLLDLRMAREELRQSRDRLRAAPKGLLVAWNVAYPWLGLMPRSPRSDSTVPVPPQVLRELPPARMLPEHERPPGETGRSGHRPRPGRGRRPRG